MEPKVQDLADTKPFDPKNASAYNNRGSARSDRGETDGALDDFNAAIKNNSRYASAYFNRGNIYAAQGDERALKDYDATLKFDRRNVNAYIARGALLLASGATAKARADMRHALALQRNGIAWQHRFNVTADYQSSNGRTSREQYLAAYEPRYQIDTSLFAYGLAQYESDRFQGYDARYSLSGGLGYKVLDGPAARLSVKAGPSWRHIDFVDGSRSNSLGGLAGLDPHSPGPGP